MAIERDSQGLRGLLTCCGLIVVAIVAGGLVVHHRSGRALRQQADARLDRECGLAAERVERTLGSVAGAVARLASDGELVQAVTDGGARRRASAILVAAAEVTPAVVAIDLVDAGGRVVLSSDDRRVGGEVSRQSRDLATGSVSISIEDAHPGDEIVLVAGDPRSQGAVCAVVSLAGMFGEGAHWWGGITSASGKVLRQNGAVVLASLPSAETGSVVASSRALRLPPPIEGSTWRLAIAHHRDEAYAATRPVGWSILGTTAVVVLVVLLVFAGALGGQADTMLSLEERERELEKAKLELEVTRERLGDRARRELVASEARSDVLASLAREFDREIAEIVARAQALSTSEDTRATETARAIVAHGRFLLELISDIAEYAKISAGDLALRNVPCATARILRDSHDLVREQVVSKGLELRIEYVTPVPASIRTDPKKLAYVLKNLFSNAIRFTATGTVLVLINTLEGEDAPDGEGGLEIHVMDMGAGLSSDEREQVFQPFATAEKSAGRDAGVALGLTISKRIAGLLGGDITVNSAPGKGSIFNLVVPTGPLEGIELVDEPPALEEGPAPEKKGSPSSDAVTFSASVIVALDDVRVAQRIQAELAAIGATVELARGGPALVARVKEMDAKRRPDVIVLDFLTEKSSGDETARSLRSELPSTPLIALVPERTDEMTRRCFGAGADDLAPAGNPDAVVGAVRNVIWNTVAQG